MKLKIRIREIDFCDIILKAMPVLRENTAYDGSAGSKIISVVTQLPQNVIRAMLEAVPQKDQCEIVTLLVRENRDKLHQGLSRILKENEIDVSLDELSLSDAMELTISVSNLNYAALAVKYLPLIHGNLPVGENTVIEMLAKLAKLPVMVLYGALAKIPQDKKDEAVAFLINRNADRIIAKMEDMLSEQDIHIRLEDLAVEI